MGSNLAAGALRALFSAALFCAFSTAALAQCRPGDLLVGENANGYRCRPKAEVLKCDRDARLALDKQRKETCAQVVGSCFVEHKTPLTVAALACVAGCRVAAGCAIASGLAGLGAESIVEGCIDKRNACFDDALAKHRDARKRCRS